MSSMTKPPVIPVEKPRDIEDWLWVGIPIALLTIIIGYLIYKHAGSFTLESFKAGFNSDLAFYLMVGVMAQLVDGALGMGYGATATSFLLTLGVPPAVSSTSVHLSEMFTTGASAISHFKFKNINKKLFKTLLIPGVIGSVIGAYLLSDVIDGNVIKPFISAYMVVLGCIIVSKGIKKNNVKKPTKRLGVLAIFGGFMDAVGGGGWGPIVTSTLIGRGRDPRYTIGSVNAAEFAVAFASGVTFLLFEGINSWQVVLGLMLGGMIAAPLGAYLVNRVNRRPLMVIVGLLVIFLGLRVVLKAIL
ncbi:sulfite exporter TauE/SafE family protein [Runella rosea]|uniref:Probable membrane transporter protein n=2 Tax=Runella rosea TaxID=2259595 RepID=A0A344TM84_9BACT|nr:sulfite exporter TauE/SafE family protein [Runella rosea]